MLRLLQLVSPLLPIGAYAYSHGLEYAVAAGWVKNEGTARDWILGVMEQALVAWDVPVLARLYRGWQAQDADTVERWNAFLSAARESAELRAEDHHLGAALARLLTDQRIPEAKVMGLCTCLATAFALAAVRWGIPLPIAVCGYLWSWCENQVAAAIKLIPLGQSAGQRVLAYAIARIPGAVDRGLGLSDEEIGLAVPGLALASALHETQYCRLFRS
jgi:urease accessory protein